jgi:thiamine pyrophosphate-dependent acetolactate synthase large subunit-like protein
VQVTDAIADVLVRSGSDTVFGVVGSGNFHVTNALTARGVRFVAARHEGGAATMADAWARTSGRTGLLSVHQGPGFTNALTGITEAAKSRTPMVVLAADVAGAAVRSNFRIGVDALAAAVGAVPERVHSPASAAADTARALRTAQRERRTVVLALPLDVQAAHCEPPGPAGPLSGAGAPELVPMPAPAAVDELAAALERAQRPVFIAGRGARISGARPELERLAEISGALLATSAAAKGLFRGSPWDLDVSGGFASPLAAELIRGADLIVGWGCALNMWTTRHGTLTGPGARVAQVDCEAAALGAHHRADLAILGDAAGTARAVAEVLGDVPREGYRSGELRDRIAAGIRWRDEAYADEGDGEHIDPRTLSIALDDMLPPERVVAVDSGNFMG